MPDHDPHDRDGDQLLGLLPADARHIRDRRHPGDFRPDPLHGPGPGHRMGPSMEPDPGIGLAAHPLFQGLLHELPPREQPPSPEWLEVWMTTARSILELLYRAGAR